MSDFPLRPVSQLSQSRTPTPSPMSPTTSVRMPPLLLPHDAPSASARGGPPRPWTPSSLNDVDLTAAHEQGSAPPRRYPAPPTGHDLMALFPPVPPATIKDPAGALPTSGWFERQERAFFARAGAEIVRVRKDGAQPQEKQRVGPTQPQDGAKVGMNGSPRAWSHTASPPLLLPLGTNPPAPPHVAHGSHLKSRSLHQHPHPHPSPPDPRAPHLSPVQPTSPMHQHHSGSSPSTLSAHSRSPPNPHAQSYPGGKQEPSDREDGYDDPEEAWRKPTPHAERRRAGKHTKRVIVRT